MIGSEIFDAVGHVLGLRAQRKSGHHSNKLSKGVFLDVAERNAGVLHASCMNPEKIGIVGHNDSTVPAGKFEVFFVGRPNQSGIDSRADVYSATPQRLGED
jgi:hypothetical protein